MLLVIQNTARIIITVVDNDGQTQSQDTATQKL